jgi:CPA2 family monovalent cation:H+ antiporter-2
MSLRVTSDFLFPVAVGASVITTFTTPYLIKFSGRVYHWLEKILPARLINRLNRGNAQRVEKIKELQE